VFAEQMRNRGRGLKGEEVGANDNLEFTAAEVRSHMLPLSSGPQTLVV
jgi:hypothetical protein